MWVLSFNFFVGIAFPGADYTSYLNYAKSLSKFHYIVPGETLSPTGHIVSGYSIGPAVFWAPTLLLREVVQIVYPGSSGMTYQYIYITHWILIPVFVFMLWRMSDRFAASILQKSMALFACFFGTALFYYSFIAVSSEFPSSFSITLLIYFLLNFQQDKRGHYVFLGILSFFTVLIRYDTIFFIGLIFLFLFLQHIVSGVNARRLSYLFLAGGVFLFGCLPIFTTNYLFTGNPLNFVYAASLPSGGSISFDFINLNFKEVLFSPWHGLITYSPFFILAILGGVMYIRNDALNLKSEGSVLKIFFNRHISCNLPYIFLTYFIFRLVVLSSVRMWSWGAGFGGRLFIVFFPIAMLSYAYLLKKFNVKKISHPLFVLSFFMAFWTLLFYVHDRGLGMSLSYTGLFESQLKAFDSVIPLILKLVVILVGTGILFRWWRHGEEKSGILFLCALALIFLVLIYTSYPESGYPTLLEKTVWSLLLVLTVFLALFLRCVRIDFYGVVIFFFVFLVVFLVAAGFNSLRLVKETPIEHYKYCGTFKVEDVVLDVENYSERNELGAYNEDMIEYRRLIEDYLRYLKTNTSCYDGFKPEDIPSLPY